MEFAALCEAEDGTHDISLRCGIWSRSGHSGLWPAERYVDLWVHGLGTTLADLLTLLFLADPGSAVRTSLRT